MVAGDDLVGGHQPGGDVGDIPLQVDGVFGSLQGCLVQGGMLAGGLDEPRLRRRPLPGHDVFGALPLRGQGPAVPYSGLELHG